MDYDILVTPKSKHISYGWHPKVFSDNGSCLYEEVNHSCTAQQHLYLCTVQLALQDASVLLDLWPGILVVCFIVLCYQSYWMASTVTENKAAAKRDVWTKTHFPLKSSANKEKNQALHQGEGSFPKTLNMLTNKHWNIMLTFCLTRAGTGILTMVQGH